MPEQPESETELVTRAQQALSRCNWEIGECAAKWTERYARGRTDADFGALIGLSGDQVYQRRRVWETFSDVHREYPELKWSHFYAALNWDDAPECLRWASDMQATVAEMKAWRRAQHGEDLSLPAEEETAAPGVELLAVESGRVRQPAEAGEAVAASPAERRETNGSGGESNRLTGAARESAAGEGYAPYGSGARGTPEQVPERPPESTERTLKRLARALERCDAALTPELLEAWTEAPFELRQRILDAIDKLRAKTAGVRV